VSSPNTARPQLFAASSNASLMALRRNHVIRETGIPYQMTNLASIDFLIREHNISGQQNRNQKGTSCRNDDLNTSDVDCPFPSISIPCFVCVRRGFFFAGMWDRGGVARSNLN